MQARTNWGLVLLLWACGLGAAAQYGKVSVVFDRLPDLFPGAGSAIGFVVSLVGFLGILFGVAAGVIVARAGFRRALLTGLAIGAIVSFVQSLVPALPIFLLTRIVEGAAHLAIVVAAPTLIAQICTDQDRGLALTLWGTFFGVAFAVLGWLGLPLVAAAGIPALWVAHGIFMAVCALILWNKLPHIQAETQGPDLSEMLVAHLRIYTSPRIGAPAIGWLFYTLCFLSALTVIPQFIDPDWRAFTIGAMPLLSIASSLTLGVFLLRRSSAVTTIIVGFVLCVVISAALYFAHGSVVLALALGAALGLVQGATFAAVPELNMSLEDRALANGGLAQMGNLGNTVGTPLMVSIIAGFGYGGMTIALMLVFLAGCGAHLALAARRQKTVDVRCMF